MVIRVSDKTQNYSKVTKLLVKPNNNKQKETILDAYTRMVFLIYDKIGKKEVNL